MNHLGTVCRSLLKKVLFVWFCALNLSSGFHNGFNMVQNLVMQHVDNSAGELINLLQGLLGYDPKDRLSAHDALRHPFFTGMCHRRS